MNKTNLITNSLITLGLEENEGKGKGRYFQSKFIEAGIAHYDELGDILITKETLDKFIHTMVGCPVIINHKDVTDKNVDKLRVGVISKVWFNELDGWYYCEGVLTDQQAIDLIKNQGWNVSCSYNFVSDNQKKTYHGKEIDMEFIDGEFLHLAIVENPRYENANIVVNSKEQVDRGGGVIKDHVKMKNPYIVTVEDKLSNFKAREQTHNIVLEAKEKGYDGVIIKGIRDYGSKFVKGVDLTQKMDDYIVFNPEQIKILKDEVNNSTDKKENIPMAVLDELKSFILSVVNNEEDKKEEKETVETEKEVENEDEEKEEEKAENKCKNEAEKEEEKEELEEKEEVIKNEDDEEEKAENEDEEEKEVENKKVKNSISDMKRIVSGEGTKMQKESLYTSQAERLELGNKY